MRQGAGDVAIDTRDSRDFARVEANCGRMADSDVCVGCAGNNVLRGGFLVVSRRGEGVYLYRALTGRQMRSGFGGDGGRYCGSPKKTVGELEKLATFRLFEEGATNCVLASILGPQAQTGGSAQRCKSGDL